MRMWSANCGRQVHPVGSRRRGECRGDTGQPSDRTAPMTAAPAPAVQREWIVKGLMAARHMPTTPVELMGVRIQPLKDGPKWTSDFTFQLGAEVEEGMKGTPIAALPPPVGFQAYHELELRIEGETARAAATMALQKFSRLAAAF